MRGAKRARTSRSTDAPLRKLCAIAASTFLLSAALGCHGKHRKTVSVPSSPQPAKAAARKRPPSPAPAVAPGYSEEGIASWYGVPYHGRPAADGEIYDMETLVAAHRVLPFNTWLRVTNLANGKAVDVRVIDRGPFVRGRVLDLSKAAARSIDLLGPGIGRVRLEVIKAPQDIPVNDFYAVQVGAFAEPARAEELRKKYAERFGNAQLALKQGSVPLWRVLVGREPSVDAAQQLAVVLGAENKSVFVVRLDDTALQGAPVKLPPALVAPPSAGAPPSEQSPGKAPASGAAEPLPANESPAPQF